MKNYTTFEYSLKNGFTVARYVPVEKENIVRWLLAVRGIGYHVSKFSDREICFSVKEDNAHNFDKAIKKLLTF